MSVNNILALVVTVSLLITLISLFIFYHIIKKSIDGFGKAENNFIVTHAKIHLVPIMLTDQAYRVYHNLSKSLSRTIPTETFITEFLEAEAASFTSSINKEDQNE